MRTIRPLDIDSIDTRRGVVRVMGKGSKERVVPVGKPAMQAVRAWVPLRSEVLEVIDELALFCYREFYGFQR